MKTFLNCIVLAICVIAIGCGQLPKVILVQPLSEQEVLDAKAALLIHANSEDETATPDQTDDSKPATCLCGGTGRSGDGLGPCACPDGCTCKPKGEAPSGETTAAEEPPAVEPPAVEPDESEQEELPVSQDGAGQAEPEPLAKESQAVLSEHEQAVEDRLADLEQEVTVLKTDQKGILQVTERLTGVVEKMAAVDSVLASMAIPAKAAPAKAEPEPQKPGKNLVVITRKDGTSQPCIDFETIEVPKLVDAGWTVGEDDSYQIVMVDIASEAAKEWPAALDAAKKNGTPYFAHYAGKQFIRGSAGYRTAKTLADDINGLSVKAAAISSPGAVTQSTSPWETIPETWPAITPINRTLTPSKAVLLWHLRGGGTGGENHRNSFYAGWPLEQMTVGQLVTLHEQDHPRPIMQARTAVIRQQPIMMQPRGSGTAGFMIRTRTCVNGKCF